MAKLILKSRTQQITDAVLQGKVDRFYDATLPATMRIRGDLVSQWADRGLSGVNARQSLPARYPRYQKTSKGGFLNFLNQDRDLEFPFPDGFDGRLFISSLDGLLNLPITIPTNTTVRASGTGKYLRWGWVLNLQSPIIGMFFITNQKWVLLDAEAKTGLEQLIRDWHISKGGTDDNFASLTSFQARFSGGNSFYNYVTEFPAINTENARNMQETFIGSHNIKHIPWLNTTRVINFLGLCNDVRNLEAIPLLNTSQAIRMDQILRSTSIRAVPPLSTTKNTTLDYSFDANPFLTSFPLIDTTNCRSFLRAWTSSSLSPQSVDNILISIAAGFAANPSKQYSINVGLSSLTGSQNAIPGTTLRTWTDLADQTSTLTDGVSWTSVSSNELVFPSSHKLAMGREVKITESPGNTSLLGGKFFVIWVSLTRIKLATSLENALKGESIILTDSSTGGKLYEVYEFDLNIAPWTALRAINRSFTKIDGTQVTYNFTEGITGQQAKSYLLDVHNVDIQTR